MIIAYSFSPYFICATVKEGRKITVINKNKDVRETDKSVQIRKIRSNRIIIKQFQNKLLLKRLSYKKKNHTKNIAAEKDKYKLIAHQSHAKNWVISQSSSIRNPVWGACAGLASPLLWSCR